MVALKRQEFGLLSHGSDDLDDVADLGAAFAKLAPTVALAISAARDGAGGDAARQLPGVRGGSR